MPRDVSPASASPSFDAGRASGLNSGGFGAAPFFLPIDCPASLQGGKRILTKVFVRQQADPCRGLP